MSDLFVCVVYGVVRLIVIPHRENVVLVRRRQGGTSKFEFAREPMLVRLAKPRGRYALEATPGDCSAARVSAPLRTGATTGLATSAYLLTAVAQGRGLARLAVLASMRGALTRQPLTSNKRGAYCVVMRTANELT